NSGPRSGTATLRRTASGSSRSTTTRYEHSCLRKTCSNTKWARDGNLSATFWRYRYLRAARSSRAQTTRMGLSIAAGSGIGCRCSMFCFELRLWEGRLRRLSLGLRCRTGGSLDGEGVR
ncbi:hypothetical protein LTR48_008158, partial [Friedmanniomyces endolithicus]